MRTPRALRLHIGIFGRRNAGKSSLLNAITHQQVSIVSDQPGTTTDPVEKPMELLPLGPVLFIDTAGIDDQGALGELRINKTRQVIERADLAVIVAGPDKTDTMPAAAWGAFEEALLAEFSERGTPAVVVLNKLDLAPGLREVATELHQRGITAVAASMLTGQGLAQIRQELLAGAPQEFIENPALIGDLVGAGELAVLVVPIDKEAPQGRLILPQVQAIRDLLDSDAMCLVVKERELRGALERLNRPPRLVVTDSQAFLKVVADVPPEVPLTSFSILLSRYKGDLLEQVRGALAIDALHPGDRVLVCEACSHHPIGEDIGRVKIPRWLTQYVGGKLEFDTYSGHDFPADLSQYRLVVHCGACMINRREVLSRLIHCREQAVPVTNYGLCIAYSLGIFERALQPFPAALELLRAARREATVPLNRSK
jgi:[FeFe] hydrogenase H-cluster maturation GTPase HydF